MSKRYCSKCGHQLKPDERCCASCGANLNKVSTNKKRKRPLSKNKKIIFTIVPLLLIIGLIGYYLLANNPRISKVSGVSNDVYYQLVEQYFFLRTVYDPESDALQDGLMAWLEKQEQYDLAKEYVEKHSEYDLLPGNVFPNPLIYEYLGAEAEGQKTERYSDKEIELIERLLTIQQDFYTSYDFEEFSRMGDMFAEDMRMKESFNPFEK